MIIARQGDIAKIPYDDSLVSTGITAVTFVRDEFDPVTLSISSRTDTLLKVPIPTGMTLGMYDWYAGQCMGMAQIVGSGETITNSTDGAIIEYPETVWGEMEYNTNNVINDNTINLSQTWSSQHIYNVLTGISGVALNCYTKAETDALLNDKADKSNTYTKSEINSLIANFSKYRILTVAQYDALTVKESDTWYICVDSHNGVVELHFGEYYVSKDLIWTYLHDRGYATSADTLSAVTQMLGNYYTTAQTYNTLQINNLLLGKADKLTTYTINQVNALLNAKANTATTYTKVEVDALIAAIPSFSYTIVSALPTTGQEKVIYLVPASAGQTGDYYDEYLWIVVSGTGKYEHIGSTSVDLTNYYTKAQTDALLLQKADKANTYTRTQVDTMFTNYYDKTESYSSTEIDTLLTGKVDTGTVYTTGQTYTKSEVDALISSGTASAVTRAELIEDEGIVAEAVVKNRNAITSKQDILVAGFNIKTINNASTIGSGNIDLVTPKQLDTRSNQYYKRETIDDASEITNEALYDLNERVNDTYTTAQTESRLSTKQDTLVSGSNIKTINNESVLGSGDISIVGTSAYTVDEAVVAEAVVKNRNAITSKQDILVSGLNIKTINSGALNASGNIDLVTPLQLDMRSNQYYKRTTLDDATQILLEALERFMTIGGNDVDTTL